MIGCADNANSHGTIGIGVEGSSFSAILFKNVAPLCRNELYTPTNAEAVPAKTVLAPRQLLGYERLSNRGRVHLHLTQHPNALLTSWLVALSQLTNGMVGSVSLCRPGSAYLTSGTSTLGISWIWTLDQGGVNWVTRAKGNMAYEVRETLPLGKGPKILSDELVVISARTKAGPEFVRLVMVDGTERGMTFMTNDLEWSPQSVADHYRYRWELKVIFRQVKQTLQIADFFRTNENAVKW